MICLDTNVVIAAMNQRAPALRARLEQMLFDRVTIAVPTIVPSEPWYGIRKSRRRQENTAALSAFLAMDITQWPFEAEDAEEAEEASDIRAVLARAGTPIGRVPGLLTEDWTE
jgi:tRNA(fMet)-specific endonuclease VapC